MLRKEGRPQLWRNKSEVTDEAICAVRDFMTMACLGEDSGKINGGYEWTRKDGKTVKLIVSVVGGDQNEAKTNS